MASPSSSSSSSENDSTWSDLCGFLDKFQRSLEDDQIRSLTRNLSSEGSTKTNIRLAEYVQMNEKSLDDFIRMLEDMKICKDDIQKVSNFKQRHFGHLEYGSDDFTSTRGWEREPVSCESDLAEHVPLTEELPPEGRSEADQPPTKRLKLGTSSQHDDSPDEDEDEDEMEATLATGSDKKFIERVLVVAKKSSDPETKVGAILVNVHGKIIGEGYNDLPKKGLPWKSKAKNRWQTKTPYVTHAAVEAIDDARKKHNPTKDSTLYTTSYPSARDGVRIYRAGIKEVVYMKKHKQWKHLYDTKATEILFEGEIITRKLHL